MERGRIEDLFTEDREWAVADWRARYLEHPLTGSIGRRLIWTVIRGDARGPATAMADGDGFVAADGSTVDVGDDDRIRLWHPIEAHGARFEAWRERLMADRLVGQPLKQAFREVYLVTPAEVETDTYSNRFAAHVIRQVQARALMKGRGWSSGFLLAFAWWVQRHRPRRGTAVARGLTASVPTSFYDPIPLDIPTTGNLYPWDCTTDQVRFFRAGTRRGPPTSRPRCPRVAFSEAMRDVDLFVGVTSIGADPQWLDREPERRFNTFWQQFGFGLTWGSPRRGSGATSSHGFCPGSRSRNGCRSRTSTW